jgi:ABC-type multidrug transport system fused ATPase/permease subunit
MNDVKRVNQQFLNLLLIYIAVLVALIIGIAASFVFIRNIDIAYGILLIVLVVMILITGLFKKGEPLSIMNMQSFPQVQPVFRKNEYERYQDNETYTIYYKLDKDPIKQIFRHYMLTVMVLIKNQNAEFYLDRVDKEINKLRDEIFKEKKKINRLIITQIKEIKELDEKAREEIKEVIFIRTKRLIISTINVGLYQPQKKAVMLYSDTYSPSLYYKYHLDEIKKIL